MYKTVTDSRKNSDYNPELELISVNRAQGIVKIRSKSNQLDAKIAQLTSEDAKVLGSLEAAKAGVPNPILKHAHIMYGDSKTGEPNTNPVGAGKGKFDPYLVIEFHSSASGDSVFPGDSLS